MTELSSELKKAEVCIHRKHCHHNVSAEMFYGVCDNVIASGVVASEWDKREKEYASFLESKCSCSAEMLIAWLNDERRKPSGVAFTDGNERRVAWFVENVISTKLENARKELKKRAITRKVDCQDCGNANCDNASHTFTYETSISLSDVDAVLGQGGEGK